MFRHILNARAQVLIGRSFSCALVLGLIYRSNVDMVELSAMTDAIADAPERPIPVTNIVCFVRWL